MSQPQMKIQNLHNVKQRIKQILEVFEFDISTTRKYNNRFTLVMWTIEKFLQKYNPEDECFEGGDAFDWAVGQIDWEEFK